MSLARSVPKGAVVEGPHRRPEFLVLNQVGQLDPRLELLGRRLFGQVWPPAAQPLDVAGMDVETLGHELPELGDEAVPLVVGQRHELVQQAYLFRCRLLPHDVRSAARRARNCRSWSSTKRRHFVRETSCSGRAMAGLRGPAFDPSAAPSAPASIPALDVGRPIQRAAGACLPVSGRTRQQCPSSGGGRQLCRGVPTIPRASPVDRAGPPTLPADHVRRPPGRQCTFEVRSDGDGSQARWVDIAWATARLQNYLDLLGRAASRWTRSGQMVGDRSQSVLAALHLREPTVVRTLAALDPPLDGRFSVAS